MRLPEVSNSPAELITNLERLPQLAQQHHDDFEVLRYMLEANDDVTDAQIDAWVETIAQPIINAIDCTQCANCCRSLDVYLTETDAQRLADGIDIPLEQIKTQHIEQDNAQKQGEWGQFKQKPCAFLNGKLCSVYEHRPESCRIYPVFTPDFRWTMGDTIQGASLCPIIYNVLLQLVAETDSLYR